MATAARSPSPSPGPGPARHCCGGAMRRSADSNPFKPLASDSPQRSSSVCKSGGGGHASPRGAWWAEKENEQRDAARAATPKARSGVCGGAGKGFMAPTISAASKASPRKKVLGERNEQQQPHPAELAHGPKGGGGGGALEAAAAGTPRRLRLSFDGAPVASIGSRQSLGGGEARAENPVCNRHHNHHAVGAAAVSADAEPPSQAAAPYDPKTNYLSPRPRFLHYKPNPRVELYRHGGGGGGGVRRLEDGFASESSDDTETTATTEEELTEEEQEQAQPPPVLNDLPEESSDLTALGEACVSPPESMRGSPQACVLTPEQHIAVSPLAPPVITREPEVTSPRARALTPEPEPAASPEPTRAKKISSLRFLFAPLALVLFIAAALVCVTPPPGSPVMSTTALLKVSEFLSVQESHPVELAAWLKQWSSSSLDLVTSYWEALASSTREQEYFGPHFAANFSATAAGEEPDHEADFYYNFAKTSSVPREEEPAVDSVLEHELKIQDIVSASDELIAEAGDVAMEEDLINGAQVMQEAVPARASIIEEANEYVEGMIVLDELDVEMSEVPGSNAEEIGSFSQNLDIPSSPSGDPEQVDNFESSESSLKQNIESDQSEGDLNDEGMVNHEGYPDSSSELGMLPGYMDKISQPIAVGVALAAVILSAALAFLYIRQKQAQAATNTSAPAGVAEQAVEAQSGSGSSEGHLLVKGSQAEETERFGGSGTSMYSSSLSSGHGRREGKEEESLSLGPRLRRESTARSTSSYGSFTTYEKIPAKKGNKEDEAMTPVRRSSRLRGQAKSPEA